MSLKKKIKPEILLIVLGLVFFFIGIFGFVVDAVTTKNIVVAWIMFAIIMLGSATALTGMIYFIIKNKEKIKKYLNENE